MKPYFLIFLSLLILASCDQQNYKLQYEHKDILYIENNSLEPMEIEQYMYVPAYSDIYYENEEHKTYLTVILSLRNISFTDTVFFDKIDYYSSSGKLLKSYIDKTLVLRPMESMEYIVRANEKEGGAGANFVVRYKARASLKNPPFIETVMMGNLDNYRFSFSSPAIPIER